MTIKGVKQILNGSDNPVDETFNLSINAKRNIKFKLKKISNLIDELKKK